MIEIRAWSASKIEITFIRISEIDSDGLLDVGQRVALAWQTL